MKRTVNVLLVLLLLSTICISQQQKWEKISIGLPDSAIVSAIVHHGSNILVGIFRATGYTYYIPGGVYLSTNYGETWVNRSINDNGEIMPVSSFLVVRDTIFAGVPGGGIYKSINDGLTWQKSDNGVFGNGYRIYNFLQLDSLLFVSTQNGVYKSSDYGRNWILKGNGLPLNYDSLPFQVKTIKSVGKKIYAGVDAQFQLKGGLFVSSDMGETWKKVIQNWVYSGVTISTDVESIEYFDGFLYVFFNGFWTIKSMDEGKSWIDDDGYHSAWTLYGYGNNLFTANPFNLFFKSSEGQTWKNITYNLPSDIWSVYEIDSTLFAGLKYNGIWKSSIKNIITEVNNYSLVNIPKKYVIEQNYPNPFNPTTTINYIVEKEGIVKIVVYDILGKKIKTLVDEKKEVGEHHTIWDSKDEQGQNVVSGIYYYSMVSENFRQTKKMILLK